MINKNLKQKRVDQRTDFANTSSSSQQRSRTNDISSAKLNGASLLVKSLEEVSEQRTVDHSGVNDFSYEEDDINPTYQQQQQQLQKEPPTPQAQPLSLPNASPPPLQKDEMSVVNIFMKGRQHTSNDSGNV